MKCSESQKKTYLLAGVLLLAAIALCVALATTGGNPQTTPVPTPAPSPASLSAATPAPVKKTKTIVYYQDNTGHLVPVMRSIPDETGIAKATLSLMVQSPYNDMEAARLGLRTVLPEGTSLDLDIGADGVARIDLGKPVLSMPDAAAETRMVNAVVQTLTEFPTIRSVRFLINGRERDTLPNGTRVGGEFTRSALNLESVSPDLTVSEAKAVTLYFPGDTGSLIVPVTRLVAGRADISTAVLELLKGPADGSLDNALPACALLGVTVENGTATVNFTQDFEKLALDADGGRLAMKALALTCAQFEDVETVRVQIDGTDFDPGADTLTIPTFVNVASEIESLYIQTLNGLEFE